MRRCWPGFCLWYLLACTSSLAGFEGSLTVEEGVVSGFVREAGTQALLPGVAVSIGNLAVKTGPTGIYEMAGVGTGLRTISALLPGYRAYADSIAVTGGSQVRDILLEPLPSPPSQERAPSPPPAAEPRFDFPSGIAVDGAGNVYVADTYNHRIRKISPLGTVSTLAGNGSAGYADGQGTSAAFNAPGGVAVDSAGTVYVADTFNHRIRQVTPDGKVSTLAGSALPGAWNGGYADGPAAAARFELPRKLALDQEGNIYIADTGNARIRKLGPDGIVRTLAGSSRTGLYSGGFADGPAGEAQFNQPLGIATDAEGNLLVADFGNNRIRQIGRNGRVVTLAGQEGPAGLEAFQALEGPAAKVRFGAPAGIALDSKGNIFVADSGTHRIRKITPAGQVATLAGVSPNHLIPGGFADGRGNESQFQGPSDIACDSAGNLYVADTLNHAIRKISPAGMVATLAGNGKSGYADGDVPASPAPPGGTVSSLGLNGSGYVDGPLAKARFNSPHGLAVDNHGTIYLADQYNHRIRQISSDGQVSTVAGHAENRYGSFSGGFRDGPAASAEFYYPFDVALDNRRQVYVADYGNNRIRKIVPGGTVHTVAGGQQGFANGSGAEARFYYPKGVAVDALGAIYVADTGNNCIRKIAPEGQVSTLAGRCAPGWPRGGGFADGRGNEALFAGPVGIDVDRQGYVYVADYRNHRIRRIAADGWVTTLAGDGWEGLRDGKAMEARFNGPIGVAVTRDGALYVADQHNNSIRQVSPAGIVTTIAGNGAGGFANGKGRRALFHNPLGIATDDAGNIYIGDTLNYAVRKIVP